MYAWGNGVNRWGFSDFNGDGNGFKLGITDNPPANHIVRNSIAFSNAKKGFIDNGNPGSLTFERNTAWNNGDNGFNMRSSTSTLKNNVAALNTNAQVSLVSGSTSSGNSWDSSTTWSNSSFLSVDFSTLAGDRASDGKIQARSVLGSLLFLRPPLPSRKSLLVIYRKRQLLTSDPYISNFLIPASGQAIGATTQSEV